MEGITYRRRKYYHLMFTISLWLTKRQNQIGKFYTGVKKQNKNFTHDCDQNSWQNIQLRMVSQFPGTDDVHLSGRRESTETLGVNSIRSKGRYCFKTVLLSRNLFYILLWHTQIWILKWNLPCSGKFVSKKWVNKWHLDYFDGGVWSVITLVKSMWIKMRKYRNEHQKVELKPEVCLYCRKIRTSLKMYHYLTRPGQGHKSLGVKARCLQVSYSNMFLSILAFQLKHGSQKLKIVTAHKILTSAS